MCKRRALLGIICGLVFYGLALGQQPRKPTAEQQEKIQQHNRLLAEAQELEKTGETGKAIAAVEKALTLEHELLGKDHPLIADSLRFMGRLHEAREEFAAAAKARKEALAILTPLLGKEHWQVTDARLDLTNGEAVARLEAEERKQLRQAKALNQQMLLFYRQGQFQKALPRAQDVIAIQKKLMGENYVEYALSLNNLAGLYLSMGDYAKALPLYEQARDIRKKSLGENHPNYATSLNDLAMLYESMGDYPKALPLYEQARDIRKKSLGENHPVYANSLHNLAALYSSMGDYPKALPLFEQARAIRKKSLGENHPDYATCLNDLAHLYASMGEYPKALPLYEQARAIRNKTLGENHPDYADSLNNLATLYQLMGDYPKALSLLEQARDLYKKTVGENHPSYALSLNNLGYLYQSMGDYAKALPLYEQARDLRKKTLGENHPDYANSLNNLAGLYKSMGDYPKALLLFEQARAVRKKSLGENHPDYALSLNNLALLYESMGDYAKALPLYEQARDLRKKSLRENHPSYATTLNNLATLYQSMGDYAKALPLYEQARDIRKKSLGENHPNYAGSLNNLAHLYASMGEYPKALLLCEQTRDILKKTLGENHPDYALSLNNLAELYQSMGDYAAAQRLSSQALGKTLQLLQATFDIVGERQRLEGLQTLRLYLGNYILTSKHTHLPASGAYPAVLGFKGMVAFRQRADLLLRDQPTLQPILQQLQSVQAQLAKAAFETPTPGQRDAWLARLKQLYEDKEKLEEQVARASKAFRNLRRPPPSLDELRHALPERTALIDLVVFRAWLPHEKRKDKKEEWQNNLVAFVVRPEQDVQMIFVDDLKPLETLIEGWRQAVSKNNHAAQVEAARQIHQLLWQPLQKHLDGVDTVLISPDGPLLRFPFAALPGKQPDTYLLEDLAIGYVTSGRQVVDLLQPPDKDLTPPAGLLTLGGVDYGSNEGRKQAFEPLPGSDLEAVRVREQFRKRFPNQRATALLGDMPTRGKVMAEINKRYRYLHLATHGFFESPERIAAMRAGMRTSESGLSLQQRSQRDDILAFLPLLRSGLVLAGANKSGGDESLLTAEDLSALDLRGTDLVVLSACETSLGKLTQGDGVLGLQRGFHAGGARTLVTSLWNVDDAATSVLMEEFYQNLWRKEKPLSKLEALRQAQLFVLKNPKRVLERSKELQGQLVKRGLPGDSLRGPKGNAVRVIDDEKTEPGQRSLASSWAGFVMSGEMAEAKK